MKLDRKFIPPSTLLRCKALMFDWFFICGYLLALFLFALVLYFVVLRHIPDFSNIQSQLIATLTSVVPIIIIFSVMEGSGACASWGKRKTHLKVMYNDMPMLRSLVRTTLKFLPWQLGHMSTINGMYQGFDTPFSVLCLTLSMVLSITYFLMAFIRTDKRHLADLLSGGRVVEIGEE